MAYVNILIFYIYKKASFSTPMQKYTLSNLLPFILIYLATHCNTSTNIANTSQKQYPQIPQNTPRPIAFSPKSRFHPNVRILLTENPCSNHLVSPQCASSRRNRTKSSTTVNTPSRGLYAICTTQPYTVHRSLGLDCNIYTGNVNTISKSI